MNNYILHKFNKLNKLGQRVLSSNILSDTSWILVDQTDSKTVFIFKSNENTLLLSRDGDITTGTWEFIVDSDNLILQLEDKNEMYNISIIEDDFVLLQKDGSEDYIVLANLTKFKDQLKSTIINLIDDIIKRREREIKERDKKKREIGQREREKKEREEREREKREREKREPPIDFKLLRKVIRESKRGFFIKDSQVEKIIFYLNKLAPTKDQGIVMLVNYKQHFNRDLIQELKKITANYENLNSIFTPLISLEIVEENYPYDIIESVKEEILKSNKKKEESTGMFDFFLSGRNGEIFQHEYKGRLLNKDKTAFTFEILGNEENIKVEVGQSPYSFVLGYKKKYLLSGYYVFSEKLDDASLKGFAVQYALKESLINTEGKMIDFRYKLQSFKKEQPKFYFMIGGYG